MNADNLKAAHEAMKKYAKAGFGIELDPEEKKVINKAFIEIAKGSIKDPQFEADLIIGKVMRNYDEAQAIIQTRYLVAREKSECDCFLLKPTYNLSTGESTFSDILKWLEQNKQQ